MRILTINEVTERIERNRKEANNIIKETVQGIGRRKKSRTRSLGEQEALTQIAIAKWKKAEQLGKIRRLSKRVIYYDYR